MENNLRTKFETWAAPKLDLSREMDRKSEYRDPVTHWAWEAYQEANRDPQALLDALSPLARLQVPKRADGNAGFYSIYFSDIERARAAISSAKGS
jgi:hypothetical protein